MLAPVVSSSSGNSAQAAKYVPGVAERRSGVDRWNHAGLSNTDSQTGSAQSLAATREYDAYGNIVNSSGTFGGPFGYAGKFGYDSGEGSLQLVGNRWYDPEVGRFITRDPAHDGGNWYRYCENNPLKHVDPSGLGWHDPTQVHVDPRFKGRVIVIGEPREGKDVPQVAVELLPGQASHPGMDVDYVIVIDPDGTVHVYFVMGNPLVGHQDAYVDRYGDIHGDHVDTEDLDPTCGLWWAKNIPGAKKRKCPSDRLPIADPRERNWPKRYPPNTGGGASPPVWHPGYPGETPPPGANTGTPHNPRVH